MNPAAASDFPPPWPATWPGQQVVELDNPGDPGAWLEEQMPVLEEALRGDASEVHGAAVILANGYLCAAEEMGFPVPSDFEGTPEEDRLQLEEEFRGFLIEWRKRLETAGEARG